MVRHIAAGNAALSLHKSVTLVALVAVEFTVFTTAVLTVDVLALAGPALSGGSSIVPVGTVTTGQVGGGKIGVAAVASYQD